MTDIRIRDPAEFLQPTLRRVAGAYAQAMQAEFDHPAYSWPTTTRRRNGETAGSPRNVVDLGTLKASQQPPEFAGLKARITWDTDYAAAVFLGSGRDGKRTLPARNVPLTTVQQFNVAAVLARFG